MRRAARADANHAAIREALRKIGASVADTRVKGWKVCAQCGADFHNYSKKSKYCSWSCAGKSPANIEKARLAALAPRKPKAPKLCLACNVAPRASKYVKHCGSIDCKRITNKRPGPKPFEFLVNNRTCEKCGSGYHSYNKSRKYCSYKCSLDAGTATKAGLSSIMARARGRYGNKKDANHAEIFGVLEATETPHHDFSQFGAGIPDGIAWVNGAWEFFDVKNPKTSYGKRGLNKTQKSWCERWRGGNVYLLYTTEEAERFCKGELDGIKKHVSAGVQSLQDGESVFQCQMLGVRVTGA